MAQKKSQSTNPHSPIVPAISTDWKLQYVKDVLVLKKYWCLPSFPLSLSMPVTSMYTAFGWLTLKLHPHIWYDISCRLNKCVTSGARQRTSPRALCRHSPEGAKIAVNSSICKFLDSVLSWSKILWRDPRTVVDLFWTIDGDNSNR